MKTPLLILSTALPLFSPTLLAVDTPPAEPAVSPSLAAVKPGLVGSSWVVEDIGKKGVVDKARTFIRFDSAEAVSGNGGINRFGGSCTLLGNKLSFGPMRVTRMAGPPAMMDQETAFLNALAKVAAFKLDEKGLLHLLDAEGKELVRLSRSDGDPSAVPVPPKAPGTAPDER